MKTASEQICFQEIPDEISLSLYISNCPRHCEGCHSPWLHEDCGEDVMEKLPALLEQYKHLITCVLFMGGDDDKQIADLKLALKFCRQYNIKTALYSGSDYFTTDNELLDLLDYLKVGSYKKEYGSLKEKTTNQRLYQKITGEWFDITNKFWCLGITL